MKHIMLLFLSEVHLDDEGNFSKSDYKTLDGRNTQASAGEIGLPVLFFDESDERKYHL